MKTIAENDRIEGQELLNLYEQSSTIDANQLKNLVY